MVEYRYMGVDLLTRKVVEDLPLYGVSLTRRISSAGNMTASFKLGTNLFSDTDLLAGSEPGRTALVALRDNVVIWAGPIWSRTYQSQANVIQLTGQTYESIFSAIKMVVAPFLGYGLGFSVPTDQTTYFKTVIDYMQAQPANNFGIDTSQILPTGVMRQDIFWYYYDDVFFSKMIDDLLKLSDSFDYTLDPYFDSNEVLQIKARTGYPYLGYGQAGVALDYPGQITNYYWPESAARGATRLTFTGKGEGIAKIRSEFWDGPRLIAGYPGWDKLVSNSGVDDQDVANSMSSALVQQYSIPVSTPTVDVKLTDDIEFGEWNNLGVPVSATIEDPRFPDQATFSRRMLGWDLSPESSESSDTLKLVLEGNDDA